MIRLQVKFFLGGGDFSKISISTLIIIQPVTAITSHKQHAEEPLPHLTPVGTCTPGSSPHHL